MLLHLLSPHSSPAACLLVCDCWAGLGRHAPAPLIISWLQLLQAVLVGLPTAALPALAIRALMPRLANRLGPAQATQWAEQEAWPGGAAEAWARLEAGGWKAGRMHNTARRIARLVASTPSPDSDTLARAAQVLGSSPSPASTTALLRLLAAGPPTPDNATTFRQTLSKVWSVDVCQPILNLQEDVPSVTVRVSCGACRCVLVLARAWPGRRLGRGRPSSCRRTHGWCRGGKLRRVRGRDAVSTW